MGEWRWGWGSGEMGWLLATLCGTDHSHPPPPPLGQGVRQAPVPFRQRSGVTSKGLCYGAGRREAVPRMGLWV